MRARLDHQALRAELIGKVARAARAQHLDRAIRLAAHQVNDRDLRTRGTLQAIVDLMLQQLGSLIEQVD